MSSDSFFVYITHAKPGDSKDGSPPPKTDPKAEGSGGRKSFLRADGDDPEYMRQAEIFLQQYEKSEGYDIDLDSFDYKFAPMKFEWGDELGIQLDFELSNKELLDQLIEAAIKDENEEYGGEIEFVEYVSANVTSAAGYCFYITLLAKDLSSPDPAEPKLYRTLVRKFRDEIHVVEFKLKPNTT